MTIRLCEHLDDYLLRDLSPELERAFNNHLADCNSCRMAVEQDRQIDGLLKSAANAIPCSLELPARIQRDWQPPSHRQWTKSISLVAALLVIGLLGWSFLSRTSPNETALKQPVAEEVLPELIRMPSNEPKEPRSEIVNMKPVPPVRVEFPQDILGLPIDSGEPDITLIQVFPVSNVSATSP